MSYNPNIPLNTDPILQSSRQIRNNFQAINAAFAENHVILTNPDTAGKHNSLQLQVTTDPTTSATQIALYQKLVAGIPELFFAPSNTPATNTPIQMTYPSLSTGLASTNPDVFKTQQYTFSAGPFIIYGGFFHNPTNGQLVTLTPGTTLIYVDVITANIKGSLDDALVSLASLPTNVVGNTFKISYSTLLLANQLDVYYFAIGI